MDIPCVQNLIKDSAQPSPDMKAAGMSRLMFSVTVKFYCTCRPAGLMRWVAPRPSRNNGCRIRYEEERGGNEITDHRPLGGHLPLVLVGARVTTDEPWPGRGFRTRRRGSGNGVRGGLRVGYSDVSARQDSSAGLVFQLTSVVRRRAEQGVCEGVCVPTLPLPASQFSGCAFSRRKYREQRVGSRGVSEY